MVAISRLVGPFVVGAASALAVLVALYAPACLPANVPSAGDAGTETPDECILRIVSVDVAGGMPLESAFIDAAIKCFGSISPENIDAARRLWMASISATDRVRSSANRDR
jgi:hypothetical protein